MEYVKGREFKYENTAITLGKFDGLHRGHQMLIKRIMSQKENGLKSVMFTFSSHPQNLLQDKKTELIYTPEEKRILLEQWGLDVLISYPFNKEVAAMRAYDFVKDVLVGQLDGKIIVVGQGFRFGHKREGDTNLLEELSKEFGFELVVVDKLEYKGRRVSSSFIKGLIAEGNLEYANHLLGSPYTIVGQVLHGRKIGRTLGFPTVNIITDEIKLLPPNGVYVSNTKIDGKMYPGVTSIGQNPTVGLTKEKRVETYLFDFNGDLYGKEIRVQILSRIRPEIKFDNIELLKEEIENDIIKGKAYFNLH
ncbi:MAG: bifunctional riboflavin kinase/FAD synthetase [Clostridiales bacterium]|nr:bifunctional riboflavin kinase/FAD synthetase [Clostridiales bacterium]